MHHYIAFLRGINLGNRRLKMDELRGLFEKMKFADVSTFIASGNVIFASKTEDRADLEQTIERKLEKALGYPVETYLRSRTEVARVTAFQPFSFADSEPEANTIHVGFLKEPLSPELKRGLLACQTEVDQFNGEGREFYWLCRIKTHESKVWSSPAIKALKLPSATMRNLTTVRKLAALYPESE